MTNNENSMSYARLLSLLFVNANNEPIEVADYMEAQIREMCKDSEIATDLWFKCTVPSCRAVQQIAEARTNPESAQVRVMQIAHLCNNVDTINGFDLPTTMTKLEQAFA